MALGPVGAGYLIKRPSVGPALSLDQPEGIRHLERFCGTQRNRPGDRMVAGNYTMVFGQGLLFYDGFGEFVRPILVKDKGPRPDYTSGANDYLRGAAGRVAVGPVGLDLFTSEKPLDFPLNPDGSVNANLDDLHEGSGDVQTVDGLRNNNTVTERVGRGARGVGERAFSWGFLGINFISRRPF
jgi:hypothetical protein